MSQLTDSFNKLKTTAKSSDDIAQWFTNNLEVIPDIPLELRSQVNVDISEGATAYTQSRKEAMSVSLQIRFTIEKDASALDLFAETTGSSVTSNSPITLYRRTITMLLPANEWLYMLANALWEHNAEQEKSYVTIKEAILSQKMPISFPQFSWKTYKSLSESGMLPESYDKFIDWVWTHAAEKLEPTELPQIDLI